MTNQNNTTDKNVNLLDTVRRLHFVGIGGSGMCPMAEILHHKDYIITVLFQPYSSISFSWKSPVNGE